MTRTVSDPIEGEALSHVATAAAPAIGQAGPADGEIDVKALFAKLGRNWLLIALAVVAALLAGIAYLNVATYKYSAYQVVSPTDADKAVATSRLSGLGDLAKLGGITLPSSNSIFPFMLYTESLKSRAAADLLAQDPLIMRTVFAAEWNEETNKFEKPDGFFFRIKDVVADVLGVPDRGWRAPDGAQLQKYLDRQLTVIEDPKKPFVRVEFSHQDPEFAVYLLNQMHAAVDGQLRRAARIKTEDNIRYLSAQLERVTLAEHREALAVALSDQEKARMAASRSAPYAADVFVRASASDSPTSPNILLVLILSLVVGISAGVGFVLVFRS